MAELRRISALPPCEWQLGSLMPRGHYKQLAAEWLKYPGYIGALPGDMRRQIESYFVQTEVKEDEYTAQVTTTFMGVVHSFGSTPASVKVTPSRLFAYWYYLGYPSEINPHTLVKAGKDREYMQVIDGESKIIMPRRQFTFHNKSRRIKKSKSKFNRVYEPMYQLAIAYLVKHAPDAEELVLQLDS